MDGKSRPTQLITFVMMILCALTLQTDGFLLKLVTTFVEDHVCYGELGCFHKNTSSNSVSLLPSSPESIGTLFHLFTRNNKSQEQVLDAMKMEEIPSRWKDFQKKKTKIIIHGFIENINKESWTKDVKNELLEHGDYNVIIVDWQKGNYPSYNQATANTRVVGAQIALLINKLTVLKNMTASYFHIIGFSLGAHAAGFAGERVDGLGRITGLDPAGLYFEDSTQDSRLDPTDAQFVDVIHTNGGQVYNLDWGTLQPMGHIDFYPNKGNHQPGCSFSFWQLYDKGVKKLTLCDHNRAIKFFKESINTDCSFKSFPCENPESKKDKECSGCSPGGCVEMGYNSDVYKPPKGTRMKYFTTTAAAFPFCLTSL